MRQEAAQRPSGERNRAFGDGNVLGRQEAGNRRNVVVLPAPLVPIIATMLPGKTSMLTPCTAVATSW